MGRKTANAVRKKNQNQVIYWFTDGVTPTEEGRSIQFVRFLPARKEKLNKEEGISCS
ncbi:MAG: hypothetical protein NC911_05740 [Candidatus Omnitrophica bacterium]|nr:hypothetical protein [Candidatus Omnitrophota bacterium]